MTARLTIDQAGRVVIPRSLMNQLHLKAGDTLELESAGNEITLRPVHVARELSQESGVWLLHTGESIPAAVSDSLLQQIRDERDIAIFGTGE